MKHATAESLDGIEALLQAIRQSAALRERSRGVFYRGGRAVLHFHADPAGLFADIRPEAEWRRLPVNTPAQRRALLRCIEQMARQRR